MILLSVGKEGFGAFVPGWDDDDIGDAKPSQHAGALLTGAGFTRGSIGECITALNDAKKAAKGKGPRSKAVKALKELRISTIHALMAVIPEVEEEDEDVSRRRDLPRHRRRGGPHGLGQPPPSKARPLTSRRSPSSWRT